MRKEVPTMKPLISDNEQRFRSWLRNQLDANKIRRFTDNSIIAYAHALRSNGNKLIPFSKDNLFSYTKYDEFCDIYDKILASPDFDEVNTESGNGALEIALKLYKHFLKYGSGAVAPDYAATFFIKNHSGFDTNGDGVVDIRDEGYNYIEIPMVAIQRIYYGVPGTGKSHMVNRLLDTIYATPAVRDSHVRRVIFHPTYSREDFIGSIKPLMTADRPLDYIFAPGPLTSILRDCFSHPAEPYYLVIEEINRGNAPAVFGDLFQLLDRNGDGKSAYAVSNHDVASYLSRDPGLKKLFIEGKVWFPPNLNILATMNTADENIFILDNAFKRRFTLQYVRINFDNLPDIWKRPYETFNGRTPLLAVFQGTALEDFANELHQKGKLNRDWPTFGRLANKLIDMENMKAIKSGNTHLVRIAENRKLGPFFVSESDLSQRDAFINKVIFYLKQDVFTYSDHYMTDSYEEIYLRYSENGADIFELLR